MKIPWQQLKQRIAKFPMATRADGQQFMEGRLYSDYVLKPRDKATRLGIKYWYANPLMIGKPINRLRGINTFRSADQSALLEEINQARQTGNQRLADLKQAEFDQRILEKARKDFSTGAVAIAAVPSLVSLKVAEQRNPEPEVRDFIDNPQNAISAYSKYLEQRKNPALFMYGETGVSIHPEAVFTAFEKNYQRLTNLFGNEQVSDV